MKEPSQEMEDQESILIEHIESFSACVEVEQLFRTNLPDAPPDHEAGRIVLWTSARSHRTFKVMVKTCRLGYALEAAKLNRALFEDMVCAHWADKFPERAAKLIVEHINYTHVLRAEAYARHGMTLPGSPPPTLTPEERQALDERYQNGSRNWTGKSVREMVGNIAGMWPKPERRLLMQMHEIAHEANNVILHHSAASLSQGVYETPQGYAFGVKASERGVGSALSFGFWTYANTISLVLDGDPLDELNSLVSRYAHLFSKVRGAGEGESGETSVL